jgi:hypothetical protein
MLVRRWGAVSEGGGRGRGEGWDAEAKGEGGGRLIDFAFLNGVAWLRG